MFPHSYSFETFSISPELLHGTVSFNFPYSPYFEEQETLHDFHGIIIRSIWLEKQI